LHPAVEVWNRDTEDQAAEERENRVAEPRMKRWHRAGFDAAPEARADDQVVALLEFPDERGDSPEIVAIFLRPRLGARELRRFRR
jgi:hypothetical protein